MVKEFSYDELVIKIQECDLYQKNVYINNQKLNLDIFSEFCIIDVINFFDINEESKLFKKLNLKILLDFLNDNAYSNLGYGSFDVNNLNRKYFLKKYPNFFYDIKLKKFVITSDLKFNFINFASYFFNIIEFELYIKDYTRFAANRSQLRFGLSRKKDDYFFKYFNEYRIYFLNGLLIIYGCYILKILYRLHLFNLLPFFNNFFFIYTKNYSDNVIYDKVINLFGDLYNSIDIDPGVNLYSEADIDLGLHHTRNKYVFCIYNQILKNFELSLNYYYLSGKFHEENIDNILKYSNILQINIDIIYNQIIDFIKLLKHYYIINNENQLNVLISNDNFLLFIDAFLEEFKYFQVDSLLNDLKMNMEERTKSI